MTLREKVSRCTLRGHWGRVLPRIGERRLLRLVCLRQKLTACDAAVTNVVVGPCADTSGREPNGKNWMQTIEHGERMSAPVASQRRPLCRGCRGCRLRPRHIGVLKPPAESKITTSSRQPSLPPQPKCRDSRPWYEIPAIVFGSTDPETAAVGRHLVQVLDLTDVNRQNAVALGDALIDLVLNPSALVGMRADQDNGDRGAGKLSVDPIPNSLVPLSLDSLEVGFVDKAGLGVLRDDIAVTKTFIALWTSSYLKLKNTFRAMLLSCLRLSYVNILMNSPSSCVRRVPSDERRTLAVIC